MAGRPTGKRSVRAVASSGLQEWRQPAVREGGSIQWSARDSGLQKQQDTLGKIFIHRVVRSARNFSRNLGRTSVGGPGQWLQIAVRDSGSGQRSVIVVGDSGGSQRSAIAAAKGFLGQQMAED